MPNHPALPKKFFLIDETNVGEYFYLEFEDTCLYLWERMSQLKGDFDKYPANNFIANFQIPVQCKRDKPYRYRHKETAISFAASSLSSLFEEDWRSEGTFVPVPPSKTRDDPEFDDRLLSTLHRVRPPLPDVRELVLQCENAEAKKKGLSPMERAQNYQINEDCAEPEPSLIFVFDDVLTTGSHYKAMRIVLSDRFPEATIAGIFLARALRPGPAGCDEG